MSTSYERLGELRIKLLPYVIQHLAETNTAANSAELSLRALQCFDAALIAARIYHQDPIEEDADMHLAHLMQFFVDEGIPATSSLPIIYDFVFEEEPATD